MAFHVEILTTIEPTMMVAINDFDPHFFQSTAELLHFKATTPVRNLQASILLLLPLFLCSTQVLAATYKSLQQTHFIIHDLLYSGHCKTQTQP